MRRKYQRSFFFVAGSTYAIICVFEVFRYWKETSTPMTSSSSQTKSDIMSERGNESKEPAKLNCFSIENESKISKLNLQILLYNTLKNSITTCETCLNGQN
jgi:hypothetical protein